MTVDASESFMPEATTTSQITMAFAAGAAIQLWYSEFRRKSGLINAQWRPMRGRSKSVELSCEESCEGLIG